jgi:hypothetical protein
MLLPPLAKPTDGAICPRLLSTYLYSYNPYVKAVLPTSGRRTGHTAIAGGPLTTANHTMVMNIVKEGQIRSVAFETHDSRSEYNFYLGHPVLLHKLQNSY